MRLIVAVCFAFALCVCVNAQEFNLVGRFPAPTLQLTALDGTLIKTPELRGKVIVYNLWFVGCPPCMEEIPKLNAIVDEYKDKDVVFIGVSSSSKKDIENFVKGTPFKYQLVANSAAAMLGGFGEPAGDGSLKIGFPMHIVVNRDGFIEVKMTGLKGVEAVRNSLKKQFEQKPQ